jgi:hypothetical protein
VEVSAVFDGEATLYGDGTPRRGSPRRHGDIYPLLSRTSTLSLSHMQTGVVAALSGPATLGGEEQRGGTQRAPGEAVPPARGPDDA